MDAKTQILAKVKLYTKENPIYSAVLEKEFNISGAELRKIIREFRREGKPIANSKDGYFFAQSYEEFKPTIKDLEDRAMSMLNTIKKFKIQFGIETDNQKSLF